MEEVVNHPLDRDEPEEGAVGDQQGVAPGEAVIRALSAADVGEEPMHCAWNL